MKTVAVAIVSVMIGSGLSAECWANETGKPSAQDANGRITLGVDVSHVGSSTARVQKFLAGLPADAATRVRAGWATVLTNLPSHSDEVLQCPAAKIGVAAVASSASNPGIFCRQCRQAAGVATP